MFRIGIISDTHGLLRPEAERRLADVDHTVHAGDVGRSEIVEALRRIAPLTVIRGNVDVGDWARDYTETATAGIGGKTIHVLHDLKALSLNPAAQGIDVVISGHSHVPKLGAHMWRALPEPRKRRAAAVRIAYNDCDAKRHIRWHEPHHSRYRMSA